jgi:hypothetical protein
MDFDAVLYDMMFQDHHVAKEIGKVSYMQNAYHPMATFEGYFGAPQ